MSTEMIDKIRALLRKTTEHGATQAEMESAMAMAQKLMTKHGIDSVSVMSAEEEAEARKLNIKKVYFNTGRQRYETDQYIYRVLERCFMVRVLWSSSYEIVKGFRKVERWDGTVEKYERDRLKQRLVYVLVGDEPDVEMAKMIIEELHPIMRRALNAHLRETGQIWNATTCHSFFLGISCGYIEANEKGKQEALMESEEAARDRYALVLVDKEKEVENFFSQIKTVRSRTISGGRSGGFDSSAFNKGKAQGGKLQLGKKRLK
jgi:hypothetical protein